MPADLFTPLNIGWIGVSAALLVLWLVRIRNGYRPFQQAPTDHHQVGVPELAMICPILVFGPMIPLYGMENFESSSWQVQDLLFFLYLACFLSGFALLGVLKRYVSRPTGTFGLLQRPPGKVVAVTFIYFILAQGLTIAALGLTLWTCQQLGYEDVQVHQTLEKLKQVDSVRSIVMLTIPAILTTPVFEEVFYRGVCQNLLIRITALFLRHRTSMEDTAPGSLFDLKQITPAARWTGIVLTSVFFALSHADWQHFPALIVLSVCMGYSYERTGSLWTPIGMHALFNGLQVVAALLWAN